MNPYADTSKYKLIYIFSIPDAAHKNLLKIGETTVDSSVNIHNETALQNLARARIKQYTNTAGINYDLLYTVLAIREVNGKLECFRDKDVHNVLLNSGIKKIPPKGTTATEWFKVDLQTAVKAVDAVKRGLKKIPYTTAEIYIPFIFRPEQNDAIKITVKQLRKGKSMLWNAKMRFGKTCTALGVIKKMKFAKTIIITHRPVVNENWYDDFNKILAQENYLYGSKTAGESLKNLLAGEKNFVYFASIQDLRGSDKVGGTFKKNSDVFNTDWDFVIVDEAHEGTTTVLGNKVIDSIVKPNTKILALSGTPFNIIEKYDDNVFTWDYLMEQRAKDEWSKTHLDDSNPYDELPQMKIFTYNLGEILNNQSYVELEDKAFSFTEFFRTDTFNKFVHEKDVKSFLNLLVQDSADSNYPFATDEYKKIFRHTLWMIPGVKEARALSKLLKKHPVFKHFNIVNVAGRGDEDEESADALKKVQKAINDAGDYGYTITLSCGKLTTGVTVPEWNAVFMLAGSYSTSAAGYMQTIFRVQSPCNRYGVSKRECYVFDFAPDRTLKMVAESVSISARAGKTSSNDRQILAELLHYLPIIAVEGSAMKNYDADKLLQQLKRAYGKKVFAHGFDDVRLYNDNLNRITDKEYEDARKMDKIIGDTKSSKSVTLNAQGIKGKSKSRTKHELSDEEKKILQQKTRRAYIISVLRKLSIRMPLLIYGADIPFDEDFTIQMFFDDNIVDAESWAEFMPKGVTKELFKDYIKFYDEDIFIEAGRNVKQKAKLADSLPPNLRIKAIAELFATFKNPDKETVLTPFKVVNLHLSACFGGWDFFDSNHTNMLDSPRYVDCGKITYDTFKTSAQILEINSKTGLYPLYVAYSIFRARIGQADEADMNFDGMLRHWDATIKENIFVICKTPMAKSITRRTLIGFRDVPFNVNANFFDNLVDTLKTNPINFIQAVLNREFWQKGSGIMKFDAVVGNPPYQILGEGDNKNFAAPIYPEFLKAAFKLADKVSLIHPARFLFNAGATSKDFNEEMLKDEHFKVVKYFPDSTEIFPTSDIKGGVVITYYDKNKKFEPIGTFVFFDELRSIMKKVTSHSDFKPLSQIMRGQMTYQLSQKAYEDFPNLKERLPRRTDTALRTNAFEIMPDIFLIEKPNDENEYLKILGNLNGERVYRYVRREYMEDIPEFKFYKVFVPAANGSGSIGEVLSTPLVGVPLVGATQTFISIGSFNTIEETTATLKYVKTKFARAMLGILKVTQHNPPATWAKVPLQNFRADSDINWAASVKDIDAQLYRKYTLTDKEIEFIESHVKAME